MEWQAHPTTVTQVLDKRYDLFNLNNINITTQVSCQSDRIFGSGASGDVRRGTWTVPHQLANPHTGELIQCMVHYPVAIKTLRIFGKRYPTWDKALDKLCHEIIIWRWLDHINVLPFCGFTMSIEDSVALISPWCEYGNLTEYLERYPEASKENLILDVAEGLAYLHGHTPAIIHADLRGANILIQNNHIACICDFGIATLVDVEHGQPGLATQSDMACGSPRWMAPELFLAESPVKTSASDMYALGGVFIEILTGKIPYHYLQNELSAFAEICTGNLPKRDQYGLPSGDTDYWQLASFLWSKNPENRPTAQAVVTTLYAYFQLLPRQDCTQSLRPSSLIEGGPHQFGALFPEDELPKDSLSPDGSFCCTISRSAGELRFYDLTCPPITYWSLPFAAITPVYHGSSRSGAPEPGSIIFRWSPNSTHLAVFTPRQPGSGRPLISALINARSKICRPLPTTSVTWLHEVVFTKDGYLVLVTQNRIGPQVLFRETYAISHGPLGYEFPHISNREPIGFGTEFETFGGSLRCGGDDQTEPLQSFDTDCLMQEAAPLSPDYHPYDAILYASPDGTLEDETWGGQHHNNTSVYLNAPSLMNTHCLSIYSPTHPIAFTNLREPTAWANMWFWPLSYVPIRFSPCGNWMISKLNSRSLTIWHTASPLHLVTMEIDYAPYQNIQLAVSGGTVTLVIEGAGGTFTRFYRVQLPTTSCLLS